MAGSIREVSRNLYPSIRVISTYPGDYGSTRIRASGQKAGRASSLGIRAEPTYPGRPIRAKQAIRVSGRTSRYPDKSECQLVPAGTSWGPAGTSWSQLVPSWYQLVPAGYQLVPAGTSWVPAGTSMAVAKSLQPQNMCVVSQVFVTTMSCGFKLWLQWFHCGCIGFKCGCSWWLWLWLHCGFTMVAWLWLRLVVANR